MWREINLVNNIQLIKEIFSNVINCILCIKIQNVQMSSLHFLRFLTHNSKKNTVALLMV